MSILISGLIIFMGIHLLPSFSNLRANMVNKFGEKAYMGLYSLIAGIGFVMIIIGMYYRDYVHLWVPPAWGKHLAMTLMLPSVILLCATYAPSNIKRSTRHPMLWGVTLWSFAHLLANGDLASLLLFGSFGIYSLFVMWSANRRSTEKQAQRHPTSKDLLVVGLGIVGYVLLLFAHPYFTGISVISF